MDGSFLQYLCLVIMQQHCSPFAVCLPVSLLALLIYLYISCLVTCQSLSFNVSPSSVCWFSKSDHVCSSGHLFFSKNLSTLLHCCIFFLFTKKNPKKSMVWLSVQKIGLTKTHGQCIDIYNFGKCRLLSILT